MKQPVPKLDPRFFYVLPDEVAERTNPVKYLAIHCAATKLSMDTTIEDITRWHKARGFTDIGYHYYIKFDGSLHKGRDLDGDGYVLDNTGAHVAGYNSVGVGICLEGGYKGLNNFTQNQFDRLKILLKELRHYYPDSIIKGHRDFPGVAKSCPSFEVKEWCLDNDIDPNW